jgi:phage host-nuclease inhibitor protein Gam
MNTTTARTRAKSAVIQSEDQLTEAVTEAESLLLEHDEIKILVERKVRAVREELDIKAESLAKEAKELVARIQRYVVANRKQVLGEKQSAKIAGHTIGFRQSPGRTAALKGYKIQDVIDGLLVIEDQPLSEKLTTVKAGLAKDAIIEHWEQGPEEQSFLRSLGIEVIKDEAFKFAPSASGKTGAPVVADKEAANG